MKPLHGARPVPAATMTTPPMAFMGSLKVGTCGKTGASIMALSLTRVNPGYLKLTSESV